MIKKMQQYLLERYPHIWNMRLLPVLAVSLLLHLLHGIVGYCYFGSKWHYGESLDSLFFSTPVFLISGILSFLVLLLWLMRVFRNNAFKSFYPVSGFYLFREFCIFLLVFFLNITYFMSFNIGYVVHGRMMTDYKESLAEARIYEQTEVLFTESKELYDIDQRQSPPPFPMTRHYRYEDEANDAVRKETMQATESMDKTISVTAAPAVTDTGYYFLGSDSLEYTQAYIDSVSGGYQYSYLNFSHNTYFNKPISAFSNNGRPFYDIRLSRGGYEMVRWLREGKKDSVRQAMTELLRLCDKYKVPYRIDVSDWFRWVYNPPYFPVTYTISNPWYNRYAEEENQETTITSTTDVVLADVSSVAEDDLKYNPKGYFIKAQKLEDIIDAKLELYAYSLFPGDILTGLLCASLVFAILIYTFRITSGRIWLISIIGSALMTLVIGLLTLTISYAFRDNNREGLIPIMSCYLLLILAFYLVAQLSVNGSGSKTVAGVALTWFLWTLPFVPFIAMLIYRAYHERQDMLHEYYKMPPLVGWVDDHIALFSVICMLLYIALVAALTPLCRRWQAMGEN